MGREDLREARRDPAGELQLKVRALAEQGLSPEQIESRLRVSAPGQGALRVLIRYELARIALEAARERLNTLLGAGEAKRGGAASAPKRRRMLGAEETDEADYYGARREAVMSEARERVRELAAEGLSAAEIQSRLDYRLTDTERELITPITRQEVAAARRARVARSIEVRGGPAASPSCETRSRARSPGCQTTASGRREPSARSGLPASPSSSSSPRGKRPIRDHSEVGKSPSWASRGEQSE